MLVRLLILTSAGFLSQRPVSSPKVPCDFVGDLLQRHGKVVQFTSAEIKARAVRKVDVGQFLKQADIKGTAIIDVLVGTLGEVVCVESLTGHPMIRIEVERALRLWRLREAKAAGKAVTYLGRLEFTLCNISCGKQGPSMTLLH